MAYCALRHLVLHICLEQSPCLFLIMHETRPVELPRPLATDAPPNLVKPPRAYLMACALHGGKFQRLKVEILQRISVWLGSEASVELELSLAIVLKQTFWFADEGCCKVTKMSASRRQWLVKAQVLHSLVEIFFFCECIWTHEYLYPLKLVCCS